MVFGALLVCLSRSQELPNALDRPRYTSLPELYTETLTAGSPGMWSVLEAGTVDEFVARVACISHVRIL